MTTSLIGSHIGFEKTLFNTCQCAISYNMNSFQFFMGNPKTIKRTRISESDIQKVLELKTPMKIFTHIPYVYSLVGSVKSLAWNGDAEQDTKTEFLLSELQYELDVMSKVGGACVIHVGSYKDKAKGCETVAKSINKLKGDGMLLIENMSGQGTMLASSFEEIKSMLDFVDRKERVGVCLDTCHAFVSGVADLRTVEGVEKMFSDFDKIIGLDKLKLIHLNDSETDYNSKKDRHARLCFGKIWENNCDPLIYLIKKINELRIPAVLETVIEDILQVRLIESDTRLFK